MCSGSGPSIEWSGDGEWGLGRTVLVVMCDGRFSNSEFVFSGSQFATARGLLGERRSDFGGGVGNPDFEFDLEVHRWPLSLGETSNARLLMGATVPEWL